VNREIVIGEYYTSIIGTDDDTYQVGRNLEYDETKLVPFNPMYRKRTIKTKDFFSSLKSNLTNDTEILPIGCKYFKTFENGRKLLIIEEPPRIRTIKVDIGQEAVIEKLRTTGKLKEYGYEDYLETKNGSKEHSFQLAFPYVVFVMLLNKKNGLVQMKPFFRLHPITSLSDYLFKAPLYNIPSSQSICLGSLRNFPNILETTENIIETFWLNKYNKDYTDNIAEYEKSEAFEVHDYFSWQYFTKNDPMFIYNVKWIKYRKNLNQVVNEIRDQSLGSDGVGNSYGIIENIVSGSTSSNLPPKPGVRNFTYAMAMGNGLTVEIGDEVIFDSEKMYLYSITTTDHGESYGDIELENEKGELIAVPYRDFEREFNKSIIKNELKEAVVQGKVIKPDDIITYKSGDYKLHKRIKSIRVAQDGKIEALIGSDHYLIENIDFEVMDLNEIKIDGEPLDKEKDYYIMTSSDRYNNSYKLKKMRYDHISISSIGNILIRFTPLETRRGDTISINYNNYQKGNEEYDFINPDKFIIPDVFCHFDKLLFNGDGKEKSKFKIIKEKGIFIENHNNIRSYLGCSDGDKQMLEKILIADGTRLFIPCVSSDIDFKIGDPIVYANWEKPEDMLTISSIDSFEFDEDSSKLYIHSTSLNKKVKFKIPYINFKTNEVNIGVIRKVESKCGDWKSGDKIKAKVAGITNFPKKDTNSIIAFINDGATKYPLAICSNLCTLWMNEDTIAKFDRIPFKTPAWSKHEITPFDTSKIKWQHGDQFINNYQAETIKFLGRKYGTKYSFEYHYCTSWGSIEWGTRISKATLDENIRHGFIMPRISVNNPTTAENKKGFPNMLGGFMLDNNSRIYLRSEQFKEDF
jgi:hypothetical protein